jgi:hypothetical protein
MLNIYYIIYYIKLVNGWYDFQLSTNFRNRGIGDQNFKNPNSSANY